MYQALYRKWRPQSFADVIGQSAICDTLTGQIESGHISHAYLFSGSRGTGKTTCAKILAKAVNCENPFHGNPCNKCPSCLGITSGEILDIVEIDAASNNGVDYVRELREEAIYTPANVKMRVYIIDEVHMFSTSAFNALLKIMEEPPAHVLFILATTELHKVPATIASRCQRFIFKRIPVSVIAERLMFIARSEGAELSNGAANYIASLADGAMRDALSLLDQCISVGDKVVSEETVESVVGLAGKKQTFDMANAIADRDTEKALSLLDEIYTSGKNTNSVLGELAEIFRDVLVIRAANGAEISQISARYTKEELSGIAKKLDNMRLCEIIEELQKTTGSIAGSSNKRIDAEICCVRLCESADNEMVSSVASRLSELEKKLSSGNFEMKKSAPKEEKKKEETPLVEEIPFEIEVPAAPVIVPEVTEAKPRKEEKPMPSGDAAGMWAKILDAARKKLSPGVSPLFASVRAELSDNILSLSSENAFVVQMLSKTENMEILREAASVEAPGIVVTAGKVKAQAPVSSGIDELLEGLEDFEGIIIK